MNTPADQSPSEQSSSGGTPIERLTELTRRSEETMSQAWEQWTEQARELLGELSERGRHARANPEEVLDAMFDFGDRLLAQQRAFAKDVLGAVSRVRHSAEDSARSSAQAADQAADQATKPSQ
jgi:hypothetical protein